MRHPNPIAWTHSRPTGALAILLCLTLAAVPTLLRAHTGLAPVDLQPPAPLAPAVAPITPVATTPAVDADFSDADFAQADQAELGDRVGGSTASDELWLFLFFYYLFFIFLAPFDCGPSHGCAPSHHHRGGCAPRHPGGGHGH